MNADLRTRLGCSKKLPIRIMTRCDTRVLSINHHLTISLVQSRMATIHKKKVGHGYDLLDHPKWRLAAAACRSEVEH